MESLHEVQVEFEGRTFTFVHDDPKDHIFKQLQTSKGFYEQRLLNSLRRFLKPGDFVIDVGANIGNHCVFFAGICGCHVLAFEPSIRASTLLQENVSRNGLGRLVTVQRSALGNHPGFGEELTAPHNLGSTKIRPAQSGLKIERLDDLNIERPLSLVKIDVEGMEMEVLKGAEQTLRRYRPTISVEAITVPEFESTFDHLVSLKYLAIEVHNYSATHVFRPASDEDLDDNFVALSRFACSSFIHHATERHELAQLLKTTQAQVQQIAESLAKLEGGDK